MPTSYIAFLVVLALAVLVPVGIMLMAPHRVRERALKQAVRQISKDTLHDLVVPDGIDGEIQIDSLLLTQHGLLVLEIRRVDGKVFGGERLDNWTALADKKRVSFANPIVLMQQRVVALRSQFKNIPVEGRVVFAGNVTLSSDLPAVVTTVAGLREEFAPQQGRADGAQIDAFYSQWDELRRSSAA